MSGRTALRRVAKWMAVGAGAGAVLYGTYVARTWCRYGKTKGATLGEHDPLLDQFMPQYDVVERHHVRVHAPAAVTLAAACDMDLQGPVIVRAIVKARELVLGTTPVARIPRGLIEEVQAMGWGILAETSGREIVVGAVTRPWEADVTFRRLPPSEFLAFAEPDFVKIAWTLRADPIGATESTLLTETRAIATDSPARRKFRWYWAFLSPGIRLIRLASFGPAKQEAERRARQP